MPALPSIGTLTLNQIRNHLVAAGLSVSPVSLRTMANLAISGSTPKINAASQNKISHWYNYNHLVQLDFTVFAGVWNTNYRGCVIDGTVGSISPSPATVAFAGAGAVIKAVYLLATSHTLIIEIYNGSNSTPPNNWDNILLNNGVRFFRTDASPAPYTTMNDGKWVYQIPFPIPYISTNFFLNGTTTPISIIQNVTDRIAPTAPTSLAYNSLTQTTLTLTWNASTDAVGVTNYLVYKGGTLLATVGNVLTYNVTGLTASTAYAFKVYAKDAASNVSSVSNTVNVTTLAVPDITAPTAPSSLTSNSVSNTTLTLTWSASTDAVGVTNYLVYKGGVLLATIGNVLTYNVTGLIASTAYAFTVYGRDAAGNVSTVSNTHNVTTTATSVDTTPPTPPSLNPLNYDDSSPEIWFSWSTSTDASGIAYYEISRTSNGVGFMIIDTSTVTNYYDMDIFYGNTYYYKIRAVDNAGNPGAFSNQRSRTASDPVDPYCFVEGTLITLDSGLQVPVETLVINQSLLSSQIDTLIDTNDKTELFGWSTDALIENRVLSSVVSNEKFVSNQTIIINNGLLEATYSHGQLIMRDNIWRFVNFKDMVCGDYLYDDHSDLIEIKDIKLNFEPRNVYKLLLSNKSHMYFANKILTHNPVVKQYV
jgi:chitodextrinase